MIDKNVELKNDVTLEESTVASCFVVSTNEKGDIYFVLPSSTASND